MNWKTLIAILLLPMYWWCDLPPFWSPVELAEYSVLSPEGSRCESAPFLAHYPKVFPVILFEKIPASRVVRNGDGTSEQRDDTYQLH